MKVTNLILIMFIAILISFMACKKDNPVTATSIELVSGNDQTAEAETVLANPIEVIVKDQNGDAFQGTTIKFILTEGLVSSETLITNANGKANITWTLGSTISTQTLTITAYKTDGTTALKGSPITVNATATTITVSDYDGNKYQTIEIGNQIWMAENLKVTHYSDGTEIPLVEDNTEWAELGDNNTDKAYCYYNNNANGEADIYGALYTWAAASNGESSKTNPSEVQGVCPDDWHLPSDDEWTELVDYFDGTNAPGGKLKEAGTTHWNSPNTGATNESGFTALPGGRRNGFYLFEGSFDFIGESGVWWSSNSHGQYCFGLQYDDDLIFQNATNKSYGNSVRCIKD